MAKYNIVPALIDSYHNPSAHGDFMQLLFDITSRLKLSLLYIEQFQFLPTKILKAVKGRSAEVLASNKIKKRTQSTTMNQYLGLH